MAPTQLSATQAQPEALDEADEDVADAELLEESGEPRWNRTINPQIKETNQAREIARNIDVLAIEHGRARQARQHAATRTQPKMALFADRASGNNGLSRIEPTTVWHWPLRDRSLDGPAKIRLLDYHAGFPISAQDEGASG